MGWSSFTQIRFWQIFLAILIVVMAMPAAARAACYCPANYQYDAANQFCESVVDGAVFINCSPAPLQPSDCNCGIHADLAAGTDGTYFCVNQASSNTFACNTPNPNYTETTGTEITSAIFTAVTTATQSITTIATEMPETQSGSVKAAGKVALTGANTKANGALLFCAEGANRELESAGTGADDIATCQSDFKAADQLTQMAAKNGNPATLSRDENLLNDAAALAALEKFEKNFGVSKEDYINRMLASHGKSSEFGDMLGSKFSEEKLDKLLTAAAEASPAEEKESAVAASDPGQASGVTKAKAKGTSLRDSLKAKLEAAEANRKLASAKTPQADYNSIKKPREMLHPAGLEPWISGTEGEQEESLTIFDVVHQKLQSLKQRERI